MHNNNNNNNTPKNTYHNNWLETQVSVQSSQTRVQTYSLGRKSLPKYLEPLNHSYWVN